MNAQPYQLLFPIGFAYSVWGALVWVMFWATGATYPGNMHANLMIGGFVMSFAAGFLMTAAPKFTGTKRATKTELWLAVLLCLSQGIAAGSAQPELFGALASLGLLAFLLVYFVRRVVAAELRPPLELVFVPLALVSGVIGSAIMAGAASGQLETDLLSIGRILFYHGTVLSLVLGVGTKLLPTIMDGAPMQFVQIERLRPRLVRLLAAWGKPPVLQAQGLLVSFVLEAQGHVPGGRGLRAAVATWVAFGAWKIYRRPKRRGHLPNFLWLSAWSFLVGLWLFALFPALAVHGAHLTFVGGFALMTLLIATRVTLAHGGFDLRQELSSKAVLWTGILALAAAATRMAAYFVPAAYVSHLAYASATWLLALLLWGTRFLGSVIRAVPDSRHIPVKPP